jgi:Domain of unknown function (DUF932)
MGLVPETEQVPPLARLNHKGEAHLINCTYFMNIKMNDKFVAHTNAQAESNLSNLLANSRQDNVLVDSKVVPLQDLTGISSRRGLENAIICENQIVNVVSNSYGHLPNEKFFLGVEEKLIDADIYYQQRSINRDNRSFVVDYILADDRYKIEVKGDKDILRPMLRFVNSYDGSCKTSGSFGFWRKVCDNGLHVAQTHIGFSVKHSGAIADIVMPKLDEIVGQFMDNEFYTLKRKFEVLAERPVYNLEDYVKATAKTLGLFKYEASDKNPEPSANARFIFDVVERETRQLNTQPNQWIVYNAFNELIHGKLKKTFDQQRTLDEKLFESVYANVI